MPTYGYACTACKQSFELEQRITEDPATECALCGKDTAQRVIIGGNFILRGTGWSADGYASPGDESEP